MRKVRCRGCGKKIGRKGNYCYGCGKYVCVDCCENQHHYIGGGHYDINGESLIGKENKE